MAARQSISHFYAPGHSERELDRLSAQARIFEPFTRQLFQEAGLLPGMRVLDVGCGSGDVALLASEFVGSNGAVVGIDRSPDAIARARAQAEGRRMSNVQFLVAHVRPGGIVAFQEFDAGGSLRNALIGSV